MDKKITYMFIYKPDITHKTLRIVLKLMPYALQQILVLVWEITQITIAPSVDKEWIVIWIYIVYQGRLASTKIGNQVYQILTVEGLAGHFLIVKSWEGEVACKAFYC